MSTTRKVLQTLEDYLHLAANLLCREIMEFLLYRGFPRPIWPAKYHERSEGYFAGKLVKGTRGEVKILISRKSCCTQFYRLLE